MDLRNFFDKDSFLAEKGMKFEFERVGGVEFLELDTIISFLDADRLEKETGKTLEQILEEEF